MNSKQARTRLIQMAYLPEWMSRNGNIHIELEHQMLDSFHPEHGWYSPTPKAWRVTRLVPLARGAQDSEVLFRSEDITEEIVSLVTLAASANSNADAHGNIPLRYRPWE